ncbi:MAG: twin-arginine translocase subunit TatB [Gammaproteobacteria bacterium]|nr:MAG: twin-arginine translocase subunit TatB [Gammaproteobacteria bacterium]
MFDIGFSELVLVAIITLLVMGPERMPGAIRTVRLVTGRIRNSWLQLRDEIERSVDVNDIRQDLHNDAVMKGLKETQYQIQQTLDETRAAIDDADERKPS